MFTKSKETSKQHAYHSYREFLEFINQNVIIPPLSLILITLPAILLIGDIIEILESHNHFLQQLSYFTLSSLFIQLFRENTLIYYTVSSLALFALLTPVFSIIVILISSLFIQKYENGVFIKIYKRSMIVNILKNFISYFVFFFLPLLSSIASKLLLMGDHYTIIGYIMVVILALNCFIIEYHTFSIGDCESKTQSNLFIISFPYRLLDDMIILVSFIIVNTISSEEISSVCGFVCIFARYILFHLRPFYNHYYLSKYKHIYMGLLVVSFGLLIANLSTEFNLYLIIIVVLIIILVYTQNKKEESIGDAWQQLDNLQAQVLNLHTLKLKLFRQGLFVKCYRELIFLSRKNNSYRTQLQIQILKSKCTIIEKTHRGYLRVCGAEEVILFQHLIIQFIENFIKASELSISIMKFMQVKEGRNQILSKNIMDLSVYLQDNKIILKNILQLNEFSSEARFLLLKFYGEFYNDKYFVREILKQNIENMRSNTEKQAIQRLYSSQTAILFINILQQMGKIAKISKNLSAVLGFQSTNLLGLSINEIIPFSLRPHHDINLLERIEKYDNKAKNKSHIQFYAYNSKFHLQEILVRYNWIMSNFNEFKMAGVFERVHNDSHVILTDEFGYLEGWTSKIGEEFNFDEISVSERRKYNIMPLFPTLIKYMDSLGVCVQTLFFKNNKGQDPKLVILRPHGQQTTEDFLKRLLKVFQNMLRDDDYSGVFFADIQLNKLSLCSDRVKMIQIVIKHYERVQNISEVFNIIARLQERSATVLNQRSSPQPEGTETSQKQELSIFSGDDKLDNKLDSNFTLECEGVHLFRYEILIFADQVGGGSRNMSIMNLPSVGNIKLKNQIQKQQNSSSYPEESINLSLSKNKTLIPVLLIFTAVFVLLVIFNIISVHNASTQMHIVNQGVIKRNKAAMIYLKSIFNPNATYIAQFMNGQLFQNQNYLFNEYLTYTTFLGDKVTQNKYYAFNTQIPATLQRLLKKLQPSSVNTTVDIIPKISPYYYSEIVSNYQNIIIEFDNKFKRTISNWLSFISETRTNFIIRFVFLCLLSLVYALLLILTYLREKRHSQTLQAFFKFEKEDLQKKIGGIGKSVRQLQQQIMDWNLLKQLNDIVKKNNITNSQLSHIKNLYETKIKFQHTEQLQEKLHKKKYYITVIIITLFIIVQTLYLALHIIISNQALTYYATSTQHLDSAAKLIVFPNYILADLYLPLPQNISEDYNQQTYSSLNTPIPSIPSLYEFLSSVPCLDCKYMYPVLTTNYKSFYSTFEQRVTQMKASGLVKNEMVAQLFFAVDTVVQNILKQLSVKQYEHMQILSCLIFGVSFCILVFYLHLTNKSINRQIMKLQMFMKFFSEETITKNKHMHRLLSNAE